MTITALTSGSCSPHAFHKILTSLLLHKHGTHENGERGNWGMSEWSCNIGNTFKQINKPTSTPVDCGCLKNEREKRELGDVLAQMCLSL